MSDPNPLLGRIVSMLEDRRVFMALMIAASAIVLIYTEQRGLWGDIDHYYANAGDVLDGKMPYSESRFEYPPLSLIFMLIPRILTWDLNSFHYGCAILTYVFIVIGSYFLLRMADERIGCRWQTHLILLCTIIFGSYFVIARNDVYPTVMAIIALWFYMDRRYAPAFIIMSLAAMTKLYPALFLIPMLLPFILKRDWRNFGTAFICIIAVGLLVESPFLLTDPGTAFAYLTYHSDRGIQVESVASSFFMVYNMIVPGTAFAYLTYHSDRGIQVESVASSFFMVYNMIVPGDLAVVFNYGSDNITGVGPDTLAPYMNSIMWAVLAVFFLVMLVRISRADMDGEKVFAVVGVMCVAMLLMFIAFSKVYSAQYYIWIVMLLPFTQLSCLSGSHRREILIILIPFAIFTMASYRAYMELGLMHLDSIAIIMTAIKNVFHVLLMLEVLHMCWCETRPASAAERSDAGLLGAVRGRFHSAS